MEKKCLSDIRNMLQERRNVQEELLKKVNRRLQKAPDGTLRISSGKRRIQYYYRTKPSDRDGIYLSDRKLISRLAQKGYDEKLQNRLRKEIQAIDQFMKRCPETEPEDIYLQLPANRQKLLYAFEDTDAHFAENWEKLPYTGKEFPENYPEYYTERGERVRSKSEILIADMLARENVPYRYEAPLYLTGAGNVYPDFTILDIRHRRELIWEHFGMMDDPEYAEKAVRKLFCYQQNGYYQGERLIITAETKSTPLDTRHVRNLIEAYLL